MGTGVGRNIREVEKEFQKLDSVHVEMVELGRRITRLFREREYSTTSLSNLGLASHPSRLAPPPSNSCLSPFQHRWVAHQRGLAEIVLG